MSMVSFQAQNWVEVLSGFPNFLIKAFLNLIDRPVLWMNLDQGLVIFIQPSFPPLTVKQSNENLSNFVEEIC
jgi:hypothetical protein